MSVRKRVVLSVVQKLEICDAIRRGVSYNDIMSQYKIGKSTISDIKKSEPKLRKFKAEKEQLGMRNAAKKAKAMKASVNEELDRALYIWFRQMREKNYPVSGPLLLQKVGSKNSLHKSTTNETNIYYYFYFRLPISTSASTRIQIRRSQRAPVSSGDFVNGTASVICQSQGRS